MSLLNLTKFDEFRISNWTLYEIIGKAKPSFGETSNLIFFFFLNQTCHLYIFIEKKKKKNVFTLDTAAIQS